MHTPTALRAPFHEGLLGHTVRRAILRGMREHPELASSARGIPEVRLVGLDPFRVLIIGAGLAVGYGVGSHQQALTGAIAEAVQDGGSRGVIVQNTATALHGLEQTVAGLGLVGATSFNLVVWCPSLFDAFRQPDRGAYQRRLLQGLQLLRETARPGARFVVCELPRPTRSGPIEDVARRRLPGFNGALRRAVAPYPDVSVAETPPFTSLLDPAAFSADYYRTWAEWIVRPRAAAAARGA